MKTKEISTRTKEFFKRELLPEVKKIQKHNDKDIRLVCRNTKEMFDLLLLIRDWSMISKIDFDLGITTSSKRFEEEEIETIILKAIMSAYVSEEEKLHFVTHNKYFTL